MPSPLQARIVSRWMAVPLLTAITSIARAQTPGPGCRSGSSPRSGPGRGSGSGSAQYTEHGAHTDPGTDTDGNERGRRKVARRDQPRRLGLFRQHRRDDGDVERGRRKNHRSGSPVALLARQLRDSEKAQGVKTRTAELFRIGGRYDYNLNERTFVFRRR